MKQFTTKYMPSNTNAEKLQKDQTFVTTKHENHQNNTKNQIIDVKYNDSKFLFWKIHVKASSRNFRFKYLNGCARLK